MRGFLPCSAHGKAWPAGLAATLSFFAQHFLCRRFPPNVSSALSQLLPRLLVAQTPQADTYSQTVWPSHFTEQVPAAVANGCVKCGQSVFRTAFGCHVSGCSLNCTPLACCASEAKLASLLCQGDFSWRKLWLARSFAARALDAHSLCKCGSIRRI